VAACALAIKRNKKQKNKKQKKQKEKKTLFACVFYIQKIEDVRTPFTKSLPPK